MISEKEIEKALNNTIEGQSKILVVELKKLIIKVLEIIKPYFDKFVEIFDKE